MQKIHPAIKLCCLLGKGKNLLSTILCTSKGTTCCPVAFKVGYNCCERALKCQQHCSIKLLGFEHKEVWHSVLPQHPQRMQSLYAKTCLGPGGWFKSQLPLIMSRSCSRNLNHEELFPVKNVNRPIDPS